MIVNTDHNGRTEGGRYTFRPLIEMEASDFPPDSKFWHIAAQQAAKRLVAKIGIDAYRAWCETLPEEGTWRSLHDAIVAYSLSIEQTEAEHGN